MIKTVLSTTSYLAKAVNLALLQAFIVDQRRAKSLVASKLGFPTDIRAVEWATSFTQIRDAYAASPFADVFRPHGYGLEIKTPDLYIDYDYSESGRPDGFDSWRIFTHIMAGDYDNRGNDKHISDRVDAWFDKLIADGKIIKHYNLFHLADPNLTVNG